VYLASNNTVSFACIAQQTTTASGQTLPTGGGVAAKCVDWGYPPWFFSTLPWPGTTQAQQTLDANNPVTVQTMHRACLSMASADYCGNGTPHTVDGTWISQYSPTTVALDTQLVNHSPAVKGTVNAVRFNRPFQFEAAWRVTHGEIGGAFCVTKTRWSTMPLEKLPECPPLQMSPDREQKWFCESYSEKELEENHALLFSYSPFLDVGLFRCDNSASAPATAWVTTSTDYLNTLGVHPPLGYQLKDNAAFHCNDHDFEGTVLRPDATGALLPYGFPDWKGPKNNRPIELYLHFFPASGKYITDTNSDSSPTTKHIGYILPVAACSGGGHFCGARLKLYKKSGPPDEYWTSTTTPPPPGFSAPKVLGHMIKLRP
jgi:hypothetical protein